MMAGRVTPELRAHQLRDLAGLRARDRSLLLSAAGSGKTAVLLLRAAEVLDAGGRVLWLTRKALLSQVVSEAARWIPRSVQPQRLRGSQLTRFTLATHGESLTRQALLGEWGLLIVDEAQEVGGGGANPRHKTYQSVKAISSASDASVFVTAEPVGTMHALDLWAVADAACVPSLLTRQQVSAFIDWRSYGPYRPQTPHAISDYGFTRLVKSLLPAVVRSSSADVEGLPEVEVRVHDVPLTAGAAARYAAAAGLDGLAGFQARSRASRDVDALGGAAVQLLLGQYAGHESVVLFSEQFDVHDALEPVLAAAGITFARIDGTMTEAARGRAVQAHRDGQARVLLITQAGEAGLNLQHASLLLSVVLSYSPAREDQRVCRIRRLGSPHQSVVHAVVQPAVSHEQHRHRRLATKRDLRDSLWDLLDVALPLAITGRESSNADRLGGGR